MGSGTYAWFEDHWVDMATVAPASEHQETLISELLISAMVTLPDGVGTFAYRYVDEDNEHTAFQAFDTVSMERCSFPDGWTARAVTADDANNAELTEGETACRYNTQTSPAFPR